MKYDEAALTVAGSPVRLYRAGAGPELVLLHGGGPDDAARSTWEPVWPALTRHARVIAPDLPGFGGTPLGTTGPTLPGYRSWLLAFLDAGGIGAATVAGLTLGGDIAVRAARDAPDRVRAVVLSEAAEILRYVGPGATGGPVRPARTGPAW
jgi:pimeloyl-ACP methyl ester carboxylesterase